MRRITAVLLSVLLFMTDLSVPVFADNTPTQPYNPNCKYISGVSNVTVWLNYASGVSIWEDYITGALTTGCIPDGIIRYT